MSGLRGGYIETFSELLRATETRECFPYNEFLNNLVYWIVELNSERKFTTNRQGSWSARKINNGLNQEAFQAAMQSNFLFFYKLVDPYPLLSILFRSLLAFKVNVALEWCIDSAEEGNSEFKSDLKRPVH